MIKTMANELNQKWYLNLLYSIIGFSSKTETIKQVLDNPEVDEAELYKIASEYFLLPALHNAIVEKQIVSFFSSDFLNAISYINDLNEKRNTTLLKQIEKIAVLFNTHHIDYVFLKGCAVLVSNNYRSLSDRMIGDIDILVSEAHIDKANQLLIDDGYIAGDYRIELKFLKHRHLPRLISEQEIGAVELHTEPLRKPIVVLKSSAILKQKIFKNNIAIPSVTHMMSHAILSHQVNDYGYLRWDLNFRAVYDYLSLTKEAEYRTPKNKYIRRFFLVKYLYFKKSAFKISFIENLKVKFLKWRLAHKTFNKTYIYFIVKWYTINKFPARFLNLIINKKYRNFTIRKTKVFFKKFF